MTDIVGELAVLFETRGADIYGGEAVTVSDHMLQAAALAEAEGATEGLVAAALLHDVGHLIADGPSHEAVGEAFLDGKFAPVVVACARLHVAAKRYLCATDPAYYGRLSPESVRTLAVQGGPMTEAEAVAFAAAPFSAEALRVRLWDEAAKVPDLPTPGFSTYEKLLRRLLL